MYDKCFHKITIIFRKPAKKGGFGDKNKLLLKTHAFYCTGVEIKYSGTIQQSKSQTYKKV